MKKKSILFLLLTVLIINNVLIVNAVKQVTIQDHIDEFQRKTKCDSVSIAIVDDEGVKFYGDEEGLYQIGSMTKAFTGLAVQKLISEGKLNEDENISDLLPGFSAYYDSEPVEIKVKELLTQTSGYTNEEIDYPSASSDMSLSEWAESISGKELKAGPGEKYAYSNVNYNLLGVIIERTTGKSYEDYMYEEILFPLGLYNTYVGGPDEGKIVSGSRLGYRKAFGYDIPVYEGRIPAGYFYSNAKDMARWIKIWLGTADIPYEYQELVDDVKKHLNEEGEYYSGWESFEEDEIGHSGGTPNYSSRMIFSKTENRGVCVLTNMNVAASTDTLCNGLFLLSSGKDEGKIATDVWTVFDIVFTYVSGVGILMMISLLFIKKRCIILGIGMTALISVMTVCIVMPLIFGAGLNDIAFIWAPYSFAGGITILTGNIPVSIIKYIITGKYENRKKAG